MTNIFIDFDNNALVMTRKFASAAAHFGSNEYRELMEARTEFPTYKIVTKSATRRKANDNFKGLTYVFMEKYIKSHANAETNLAEFEEERTKGKTVASATAYSKIKKWFLEKYPEIAEFAA